MSESILHIMNDEKVIDRTIDYFEAAYPYKNVFIILAPTDHYNCKYVTNKDKTSICAYGSTKFKEAVGDVRKYKHILIHLLDDVKIDFINSIDHPNITWLAWGTDLYEGLLSHRGYQQYDDPALPCKAGLISTKRKYFGPLARMLDRRRLKKRIEVIRKIANIAAIEGDYRLLLEYYPEFGHLHRTDYFYYPIDAILRDELMDAHCSGSSVIVGNSASPTGNHLHALNILLREGQERDIIIPLSYGHPNYRDYLLKEIAQLDLPEIKPLLEFMPLPEYNQLLTRCGNFVYANLRQEALGNILIALYLGGKVFFDIRNPLYRYFKGLGIRIFSLEEISVYNLDTPLPKENCETNRRIILSEFNFEKLLTTIKTSFAL